MKHDPKRLLKWFAEIYELDGKKCMSCGETDPYLLDPADHILPRGTYPEFKYEIWNGIQWCRICHDIKHKGTKNRPEGVKSSGQWPNMKFWEDYVSGRVWLLDKLKTILEDDPDHRCKKAYEILKTKSKEI